MIWEQREETMIALVEADTALRVFPTVGTTGSVVIRSLFTLFIVLHLFGCGERLELKSAKRAAEDLLESVQKEDYGRLSEHYVSYFFQEMNRKEWEAILKEVNQRLGPIHDYSLLEAASEQSLGQQNHVVLLYEVMHDQHKSSHTITVVMENGRYKIYGHKIGSDAL